MRNPRKKQPMHLPNLDVLVQAALQEDIGTGDVTAALVPAQKIMTATVITREPAIICGIPFVNATFHQVSESTALTWHCQEGDRVPENTLLLTLSGDARALLTAERTALNFLQLLSGTATCTRQYVDKIAHTACRLLDSRKTLPGLRLAQKYAVTCGGGYNHRMGLYDAFLIKENHIAACGSITTAIIQAKALATTEWIEVEVESLTQLQEAITAKPDRIMLDNFTHAAIQDAVAITQGRVPLEVSGNITLDNIAQIAETGVDFISVGAITKHLHAVDLSMRICL